MCVCVSQGYLPFEEARAMVRAMKMTKGRWRKWANTDERPRDIPFEPDWSYRGRLENPTFALVPPRSFGLHAAATTQANIRLELCDHSLPAQSTHPAWRRTVINRSTATRLVSLL